MGSPSSALAVTAALLLTAPSRGEDLASASARERERRRAVHCPSQAYTDAELERVAWRGPRSGPRPAAPEGSTASSTVDGDDDRPGERDEEEEREDRVLIWRLQLRSASERAAELTLEIDRLQVSLGVAPAGLIAGPREERMARLERARVELATEKERVEAMLDEGRRAGYR